MKPLIFKKTLTLRKLPIYFFYLLITCTIFILTWQPPAHAEQQPADPEVKIVNVSQTMIQMKLMKGVTAEQAINAMVVKASSFNLQLVGRQRISLALNQRGIKTPLLELLQFCNPVDAGSLVAKKIIYAAYIPCQISITANNKGEIWLLMKNMDMMIDNEMISAELAEIAININQSMLAVMTAGATGKY